MNNRIKEIATDSDISLISTDFTGCLLGDDYLVTDRNLTEMQLSNFAESIIKECVLIAALMERENRPNIGATILDRFGIEK